MKKLTNFFLKKRSVNGSLAFGIIGTGVVAVMSWILMPFYFLLGITNISIVINTSTVVVLIFIAFSLNQTFKASASIGESIGNTLVKCTIQLIISVLIALLIGVLFVPLRMWFLLWQCVQDSWAACFP